MPLLRRDFEKKEDVRDFANSQLLDLLYQGSDKNKYHYCVDSTNNPFYLRAIGGHSGGTVVGPTLLDNVAEPLGWKEYLYHVGGSVTIHSIMQTRLIAGSKESKGGTWNQGTMRDL